MSALEQENKELRSEILNLFKYIQRLRSEIAKVNARTAEGTHFQFVAAHLDTLVGSTGKSSAAVLEELRKIDKHVDEIRLSGAVGRVPLLCERINDTTAAAIEACTFQDAAGESVNHIAESMKFLEERVNAIIDICGRENIETIQDEIGQDNNDTFTA